MPKSLEAVLSRRSTARPPPSKEERQLDALATTLEQAAGANDGRLSRSRSAACSSVVASASSCRSSFDGGGRAVLRLESTASSELGIAARI